MKILHVVNTSFVLPYFLGDQIEHFTKTGVKIYIACHPSSHLREFGNMHNCTVKEVEIIREISFSSDFRAIMDLRKFIKNEKIDIVIGHTPKGGLIGMVAAYFSNVEKRIYFRHGLMYETSKGFKRLLLIFVEKLTGYLATKVVCVSDSVRKRSVLERLNSPRKNVLLNLGSCNGIDTSRFSNGNLATDKLKLRDKFGISSDDFVVGFVGRLVNDKGINELIEAWKILQANTINATLLIVGPYEERDSISFELKQFIKNESTILHVGLMDDVIPYYKLMDLFILPSYREGFPTVVLEASAMELPVVTTRSTGCIDSIIENETGIFCNIEPMSISEKILYYLNNPAIAKQHGRNGRKFVLSNFQQEIIWNEIKEKLIELK